MTNKTTDALQAAIESLGAVEVAPGRYAVQCENPSGWVVVRDRGCFCGTGPGLADLIESFAGFPIGSIDLRPAMTHAVGMPAWWTPDARFAWRRIPFDGRILGDHELRDYSDNEKRRITADLATGEEVPA